MNNQYLTIAAVLGGMALLGAAVLGGERVWNVIPFATSSEHMELAGEVGQNTVSILENTADDLARAENILWDKILALDLAKIDLEGKDMDLPIHLVEQRRRIEKERKGVKEQLDFVRDEIIRLNSHQ